MYKKVLLILLVFHLSWLTSRSFAGYPDFVELNSTVCVPIDQQHAEKLPSPWRKYLAFTKICPLSKTPTSKARVFIVSVWTEDYLNTKQSNMWEEFPSSIIVDGDMNILGALPVIFPIDPPTEPAIYFGRWKATIPTEIRVDVYDPTVSGDRYYPPLIWNNKQKRFRMLDKEPKSGHRPGR
ncbi:hypothetical protein [Geomonas subterranea]|uniref:Uncharacterized protein n=1 Tax=Geomonas subterranea TaxID=2847989 RepID=A0ABX8LHP7_9BACT|nr:MULTISPECIES: hypothetical protein [Geomonas]QXE90194.1 hypothetical protein KP001_17500 [Geomonas subterranea]QXM07680.1 hypothetical protein KP002_11780 [Geomonas subterranea]